MSRFAVSRPTFGRKVTALPPALPAAYRRRAREDARRAVEIAEARLIVQHLPAPGEAVHALMSGRFDLALVLAAVLEQEGPASARIATLSYNARSFRELLSLLDNKLLTSCTLLASTFFRAHNEALWEESKREFDERGQRVAVAYNHAKVIALDFGGTKKIVLEGSANLRSNRNVEQIAILADTGLHDWHVKWIEDYVTRHRSTDDAPATETA